MFHPVYVIWFLLPFILFSLSIWALVKPYFGVAGKEDAWDYCKQAIFSLVGFGIAVGLDQLSIDEYLSFISDDETSIVYVVHWILYPAVLLGMAYLSKFLNRSNKNNTADELSFGLARYKR